MPQDTLPKLLLAQRERLEPKLEEIGDTWEDLCEVVRFTTCVQALADWTRNKREVAIWGAYDAYRGVDLVQKLVAHRSGLTLIITSGVYGREKTLGDFGALYMWERLLSELSSETQEYNTELINRVKGRLIIDSFSHHTGDQRILLGSTLLALAPDKLFVVQPLCHMTRFVMCVGLTLYTVGFKPWIRLIPHGTWDTQHTGRGPKNEPDRRFSYEELLALPQTPSRHEGIMACGELDKVIYYASLGEALTFRQTREWLSI